MKTKLILLLVLFLISPFLMSGKKKKKRPPPAMQKVNYTLAKDLFIENAQVCLRNIFFKERDSKYFRISIDKETDTIYVFYREDCVGQILMPRRLTNQKKRIAKLEAKLKNGGGE